jgi:hypothetical protein
MNLLDIAVNGALGADADSDTRNVAELAALVATELAAGSDITDACAAAVVSPARYLGWVEDLPAVRESHARALRIRAALLADHPLALARTLADQRTGRAEALHGLEAVARAVTAEAGLVAKVARPEGAASTTPTIRIVFDTPANVQSVSYGHTASDTLSDSTTPAQHSLSDGQATDYAIIEGDELDD